MNKTITAVILTTFAQYTFAAQCPTGTLNITKPELQIPKGFVKGLIVTKTDTTKEAAQNIFKTDGHKISIDKRSYEILDLGAPNNLIRWFPKNEKLTDTPSCTQEYSIDAKLLEQASGAGATNTNGGNINDCYAAAAREHDHIKSLRGDKNFSFIAFCSDKTTYQPMRSYGVKGDPIYISLYDNGSLGHTTLEIQSCSLEQEGVSLYNQTAVSNFRGVKQAGTEGEEEPYILSPPVIRTCYDNQVVINLVDRQNGDKVLRSHVLNQHTRYHGSFMLGTLFTDKVSHKYLVGNNGAGATVIRDEGPFKSGPTYVISLLLHGFPHYILDSEPYHGRDILHDNGFKDRLGLMLGVGIDKPQNNLAIGLSYELMRGINLTYSTNWSRITELDGVKVGDAITAGTPIPTRDRWERFSSIGLSIDFGYVTGLYGK